MAYTTELQAYPASELYTALRADISQESLTLAATWVIGEYNEVLLEGGLVDEDQPKPVRFTCSISLLHSLTHDIHGSQLSDAEVIDLLVSTLDSPYANYLTRQFVLTALTKITSRPTTTDSQQERIQAILASYTTSPDLEIQQRAVEFANLFNLGEIRSGVLEHMPAPELKQTVIGVGA